MSGLRGKVVIITGGSTGIGRATALALGTAGAHLVLAARSADKLRQTASEVESSGGVALAIPTDVTQEVEVVRLFDTALEQCGRLDALVNNAGSGAFAPIIESEAQVWRQTLDVALTATYLCSRQALNSMLPQGHGQIINVLSIAAKVAFKGASAYCAAKAGALAFTRVLAEEVRDQGIQVTALCPGSVATPFWDSIDPKPDLDQMQKPEDVANVIRWVLLQPEGIVIDEVVTTPPLGIL